MRQRLLIAAGVLAGLGLSIAAAQTRTFPGDPTITHWFQRLNSDGFEDTMQAVSRAGGTLPLLLIALAAGAVLVAQARRAQALVLPFVATGGALAPLLKAVIGRPRPSDDVVTVLTHPSGLSFPSGHAFMAITLLGALFYLAGDLCGPQRRWAAVLLRIVLALAILGIGASRIYLGAHWASDVLGGYVLGGLTLFAGIRLAKAWAGWRLDRASEAG